MDMKNLTKQLQEYCDRINSVLTPDNGDKIKKIVNEVTSEMFKKVEHSSLYFSRSVYIANLCESEKIKQDLLQHPRDYILKVSDDLEEHPGITIHFRDNEKDDAY